MARLILVVDDGAALQSLLRDALRGVPAEQLAFEALPGLVELERLLAELEPGRAEPKPLAPVRPGGRRALP
jgi:hypothetical protein